MSKKSSAQNQDISNARFIEKCTNLCTFGYVRYHNANEWHLAVPVDVEFLCYQFLGQLPMTFNYIRMSQYFQKMKSISVTPMHLYLTLNSYSQNSIESALTNGINNDNYKQLSLLPTALSDTTRKKFDRSLNEYLTHGSIQKLVDNNTQWKTVGIGKLEVIQNKYNPTKPLLKLVRKKKKTIHIFQCKPKNKAQGKSIILKAAHTITNTWFILAVRFNAENSEKRFKFQLDEAYKLKPLLHARSSRQRRARTQSSNIAWDCQLCLHHNGENAFYCIVCNSPKPLPKTEDIEISRNVNSMLPQNSDDKLSQLVTFFDVS